MQLSQKLAILADAAKYDASCASSGTTQRDSSQGRGIGSTTGMGICHSYAPDGRCISLLKLLLTNFCLYDCHYCINRASSQVQRARFNTDEVVSLTLEFYKRNYIEGLFLSSGIIRSSDYTMEQLIEVARSLRQDHDFRGYIHLKTIPDASPELIEKAGLYADRLSINIELPSETSLVRLAPEKNPISIHRSMGQLHDHIAEAKESRKITSRSAARQKPKRLTRIFSPAGQSTQMIIGADDSNDAKILLLSKRLYRQYKMRRVYYSAFSPIPDSSRVLPTIQPPLMREHRLYQADWLLRFYGFSVEEITHTAGDGMLDLDIDPKLAWALRHRDQFPVDVNRASRELLLRVPGIGARGADRLIQSRRIRSLGFDDLSRCGLSLKKVAPFVETRDYAPKPGTLESETLKQRFSTNNSPQLALF